MIKINSLTKKFNKGKSNEVDALRGINLELGDRGLYAIFGKSGSGKTTLMNMIGGLDKFDGGGIEIDGKTYTKLVDDKFRVDNIGYIFQNYCLDSEINVYENVAMGLRTIGIVDEELIFNRSMTALANVDMEEYYKRDVTTLSGGQQQRVAIARVMAKGAKIILADEPTGNLDEYNTHLVMDILKELSRETLVILVTHERDIVDKYADKVISVGDGAILNETDGVYVGEHTTDKNYIFLGDMAKKSESVNGVDFEFYGDTTPCKIKIVGVDGKYYIQTDSQAISYIDNDSEVKLIDEKRESFITKEKEARRITLRDLGRVQPGSSKKVFNFSRCFIDGLRDNFGKGAKVKGKVLTVAVMLLCVALMLVTCFMGGSIHNYNNPSGLMPADTVAVNVFGSNSVKTALFNTLKDKEGYIARNTSFINIAVEPFESSSLMLKNADFVTYRDKALVKDKTFVAGKYTDDIHGIVLTDKYVKEMYKARNYKYTDSELDRLIGAMVYDGTEGELSENIGYIEGVIRDDSTNIYGDKILVEQVTYGRLLSKNVLKIAEFYGEDFRDDTIYLTKNSVYYMSYDETTGLLTYDDYASEETKTFKAEILDDKYGEAIYMSYATFLKARYNILIASNEDFKTYIFSKDTDSVVRELTDVALISSNGISTRNIQLGYWQEREHSNIFVNLTILIVLFALMMVLLGLLMFSNFSSKVKEVGIYRAIGVSKANITLKVFAENVGTVILAVVVALLVVGLPLAIATAGKVVMGLSLDWWLFATIFIVVVSLSCLMSVLPVMTLLRKTPREILTKYDL